jgi:Uma2 family endonuclease
MGHAQLKTKKEEKYTYADYLSWPEDERWEIIDGDAYNMCPAPSRIHQALSGVIFYLFYNYLKGKNCKIYHAPFDVRLSKKKTPQSEEDFDSVVQPDLTLVCDKSKLDERGCKGAPDLVIEILSPFTAPKDFITKTDLYERNAIKEYWVVHPVDKLLTVYLLGKDGKYGKPKIYSSEDIVKVKIFSDLKIKLKKVFDQIE